jgi:hypothetical protein
VGNPAQQLHDWEPGIARSGLFWTIPIRASMLRVDPRTGRARLRAHRVAVKDFHDFINAVLGGGPAPVPSHVSFDVHWAGGGKHRRLRDSTFHFAGRYVTGPARIQFTAYEDGGSVVFSSEPAGQYNPTPDQGGAGSPAVGHERNGRFFL